MKMETAARKRTLVYTLNQITGLTCELTVRGEKDFTISFDGENPAAAEKVKKYFGAQVTKLLVDYDGECDQTAIYFSVN